MTQPTAAPTPEDRYDADTDAFVRSSQTGKTRDTGAGHPIPEAEATAGDEGDPATAGDAPADDARG